ncbi:MAG: efflux RND transporter periplasmic adaptor subunit [Gallionella sp.]|nr:efflux RND transporter periplasmic adaptor subunit [Gallionella sp.]
MSLLKSNKVLWAGMVLVVAVGAFLFHRQSVNKTPAGADRPALTVVTTVLKPVQWQQVLNANGNVVPWQEAIIGSEITGVRIVEVRVSVGDKVTRGQVLATLANDTLQANEAESQAALKESEAVLAEASANAARMRKLSESGFVSAQQAGGAIATENTARARFDAQRARMKVSAERLTQQNITAPDAGVISARSATVGALTQPGAELFRLIRQGRIEWHADVAAEELSLIKKGMKVELASAQGNIVQGTVRAISPMINPQTRYGQVLVDLPANSDLVAGMFAKGVIVSGERAAMVLPQSAVLLRDNYAYVYVLAPDFHVAAKKVATGRRQGNQIEIVSGLAPGVQVVESGGSFLVEGDLVRVTGTANNSNSLPHSTPPPNLPPQAGVGANGSLREDSVR